MIVVGAGFGGWNVLAWQAHALLTPAIERIENLVAILILATVPLMFVALVYVLRGKFIPGRVKRRCIGRAMTMHVAAVALALGALVWLRPSWPFAYETLRAAGGPEGRTAYAYVAPSGDACASVIAVEDGTLVRIVAVVSPTPCDEEPGRLEWRDREIALVAADGREITSGTIGQWHQ